MVQTDMDQNTDRNLSPDKPVKSLDQDLLGFAPFASNIANAILGLDSPDGFVIGIHGIWGSGKTTMLNLVQEYLFQETTEENRPLMLRFNPWWFSGQDILFRFFQEVTAALGGQKSWKAIRTALLDFAEVITPASSAIPYAGGLAVSADRVIAKLKASAQTSEQAKDALAIKLTDKKRNIIVFVDDIDRLTSGEIRDLFQLVKTTGDLPHIIYLLAFDRDHVSEALSASKQAGYAYIEKIVQLSFDLPEPDFNTLQNLLFHRLENIFTDSPDRLWETQRWQEVYLDGLKHLIATPREAFLLTNALSVTFPPVTGEVNPVDFIAIEALRLLCRPAYEAIRRHESQFTGLERSDSRDTDRLIQFHNEWIQSVPQNHQEPVKNVVCGMFPKVGAVWKRPFFSNDDSWRSQLRIASTDIFPVYFRFGVPSNLLSANEMNKILSLAPDPAAFAEKLLSIAKN